MRISEVKTYKVRGRGWPNYPWVIVEVCTDEGISGLGESTPREGVFEAIEALGRRLVGQDPFHITRRVEEISRGGSYFGSILFLSGIEVALWDILGKALGVPVHQLLGGPCHDRIRVYVDGFFRGADYSPGAYAHQAREIVDRGFTALKMDIDGPLPSMHRINGQPDRADLSLTVDIVAAVREAIGQDVDLAVDTHGRFNLPTMMTLADRLEPYDLMWIEDPVSLRGGNIRAMAKVTTSARTPICSGETLARPQYRELFEQQAADIIMPDITYCGGMMEMVKIAAMAETYHIPVAPHNMYGPIATMASVQACACTPNFTILEYQWGDVDWRDDIISQPITTTEGHIDLPDGPGIGVALNRDGVRRHAA